MSGDARGSWSQGQHRRAEARGLRPGATLERRPHVPVRVHEVALGEEGPCPGRRRGHPPVGGEFFAEVKGRGMVQELGAAQVEIIGDAPNWR